MKKIILMSAMAVFLFGMTAQAASTISWNFTTLGDTEGWVPTNDSLSNGVTVANAVQGSEVVLTTPDITGGDPGIVTEVTNSVPVGEFWDTIEIRLRTLDGNGGNPATYNENYTLMVINGNIVNSGAAWTKTYEADEWVITSFDISGLGANDITYLRLDPPASESQNFEYDSSTPAQTRHRLLYTRATGNSTPPAIPKGGMAMLTPLRSPMQLEVPSRC